MTVNVGKRHVSDSVPRRGRSVSICPGTPETLDVGSVESPYHGGSSGRRKEESRDSRIPETRERLPFLNVFRRRKTVERTHRPVTEGLRTSVLPNVCLYVNILVPSLTKVSSGQSYNIKQNSRKLT